MSRTKLLLHVGMPKTASSLIQDTLCAHAGALAESGIIYPEIGRAFGAHHRLIRTLVVSDSIFAPEHALPAPEFLAAMERLAAGSARIVILSSEGLSNATALTPTLSELQAFFDLHVVAYFRHPLDYANSYLNQMIKMRLYPAWEAMDPDTELRHALARSYAQIIAIWEEALPGARITVRPMHRSQDMWQDFAGLVDPTLTRIAPTSGRRNVSLPPEALQFITRYLNQPREKSASERSMMTSILDDYALQHRNRAPVSLISPEMIEALPALSEALTSAFCDRYFGEGERFSPPSAMGFVDYRAPDPTDCLALDDYLIGRIADHVAFLTRGAEPVR